MMIHPLHRNIKNKETIIKGGRSRERYSMSARAASFQCLTFECYDFAIDDVIPASLPSVHHERVPLKVQHYQWHDLAISK